MMCHFFSGQRVADADGSDNRPLEYADGRGDPQADDETDTLERHVADNGQIYSGVSVLILVTGTLAVVRRALRRGSSAGARLGLRVHQTMLPPLAGAHTHPSG
jgi:hypothetical protein